MQCSERLLAEQMSERLTIKSQWANGDIPAKASILSGVSKLEKSPISARIDTAVS